MSTRLDGRGDGPEDNVYQFPIPANRSGVASEQTSHPETDDIRRGTGKATGELIEIDGIRKNPRVVNTVGGGIKVAHGEMPSMEVVHDVPHDHTDTVVILGKQIEELQMLDAESDGKGKILEVALDFGLGGKIPVSKDSKKLELSELFSAAAERLLELSTKLKDLRNEDIFDFVAHVLLYVWSSDWEHHLSDDIVVAVIEQVEQRGTTEKDLIEMFQVIDLCSGTVSFETVNRMLDLVDNDGEFYGCTRESFLAELQKIKKNCTPPIHVVISAFYLANTLDTGLRLSDILTAPHLQVSSAASAEVKIQHKQALNNISIKERREGLLNKLRKIREVCGDPDAFDDIVLELDDNDFLEELIVAADGVLESLGINTGDYNEVKKAKDELFDKKTANEIIARGRSGNSFTDDELMARVRGQFGDDEW